MARTPVSIRVGDAPSTIIQAEPRSTIWNWAIGLVKLRLQGAEYSFTQTNSPCIRTSARTSDIASEIPVIAGITCPSQTLGKEIKRSGYRTSRYSAVNIAADQDWPYGF